MTPFEARQGAQHRRPGFNARVIDARTNADVVDCRDMRQAHIVANTMNAVEVAGLFRGNATKVEGDRA